MSPLSDTTNLAPAMAGTDLFTHIKYMTYTTVPTIIITLVVFAILSGTIDTTGSTDVSSLLASIKNSFQISPILFLVPGVVIAMILLKTKPLVALGTGVVLAAIFAFIYQKDVLTSLSSSKIDAILTSIWTDTQVQTNDEKLTELFSSGVKSTATSCSIRSKAISPAALRIRPSTITSSMGLGNTTLRFGGVLSCSASTSSTVCA